MGNLYVIKYFIVKFVCLFGAFGCCHELDCLLGSGALLPLNHFQFVLGVILANLFANFCSKMIVFGVNPKVSP